MTIVAVAIGALYALDAFIVAPWAHGDPRLTRNWVGQFTTPQGHTGALELSLYHTYSDRHRGWDHRGRGLLAGNARACGLSTWPRYDLRGSASHSGDDVLIVIGIPQPAPSGLYFQDLRGSWSGQSLQLSGVLGSYSGKTHTVHSSAPDESQPTHLTLHPGTDSDYDRLCVNASR